MKQGLTLLEHTASCEDDMHVRGQDLKEGMVLLKYLKERSYANRAEQPNALMLPSQQTDGVACVCVCVCV